MKKTEIYRCLLHELKCRRERLEHSWKEILESNQQEGKSAAGDKHETGAAMIHLEMEQLGRQLEELKKQEEEVVRYSSNNIGVEQRVVMGSLVSTNVGLYYVITGFGKLQCVDQEVYIIGRTSPAGQALWGKSVGERFEWGRVKGEVISIE